MALRRAWGRTVARSKTTKPRQPIWLLGAWGWLRRMDLHHRPSGYEPDELATAPLRHEFRASNPIKGLRLLFLFVPSTRLLLACAYVGAMDCGLSRGWAQYFGGAACRSIPRGGAERKRPRHLPVSGRRLPSVCAGRIQYRSSTLAIAAALARSAVPMMSWASVMASFHCGMPTFRLSKSVTSGKHALHFASHA